MKRKKRGCYSTGLSCEYLPLRLSALICEATHRRYSWWWWQGCVLNIWWMKDKELVFWRSPRSSRKPLLRSSGPPSRPGPGFPPQSPWHQHCDQWLEQLKLKYMDFKQKPNFPLPSTVLQRYIGDGGCTCMWTCRPSRKRRNPPRRKSREIFPRRSSRETCQAWCAVRVWKVGLLSLENESSCFVSLLFWIQLWCHQEKM